MSNKKRIAAVGLVLAAVLLNVLIFAVVSIGENPLLMQLLLCVLVDMMAAVCLWQMESLVRVPLLIWRERGMVWELVKNDFRARFAGSYLGLIWAFVQPLITITLYWFVFQVGLRTGGVSEHPFILYLMAGLIPWFYFSEAWTGATASLLEYNYLVKKVRFDVETLPVLKVASALFVHLFFVAVIVVMSVCYGYGVDLYTLQLLYYISCTMLLTLGLAYITAACTVFFRDMTQIVNVLLSIGVWVTPIMWSPAAAAMPEAVQKLFKLNPVYYIVDGFRDALLGKVWFWEKPLWSVYFWVMAIGVYLIGVKLFNRLKVHFADVL